MKIAVVRESCSEDGGVTWEPCWNVVDTDAEPSDRNNHGVLAMGCPDRADAIMCAIGQGWLVPGSDS